MCAAICLGSVAASTMLGLMMLWGNGSRVGVGAVYTAAAALVAYRCGFGAGVVAAIAGDTTLRLVFNSGPFQLANPGELIILAGMLVCCYVAAGRGRDSATASGGGGTTIGSEATRVREWAMMRLAMSESVQAREIGIACAGVSVPTVASVGILLATGSMVGTGALYALAIGLAAKFGSRRAALCVAIVAILIINYMAVPHWQFSVPTVNETILYGALVGLAFLAGHTSAQTPTPKRGGGGGIPMLTEINGHKFDIKHIDYNAGSYAFDCETGAQKARKQVHEIIVRRSPEILIWSIRDMVGKGRWTGEEIGYVSALARHLSGSLPIERQDDSDDLHS